MLSAFLSSDRPRKTEPHNDFVRGGRRRIDRGPEERSPARRTSPLVVVIAVVVALSSAATL